MTIIQACPKKLTGGLNILIVRMPLTDCHKDAVPEACFAIMPGAEI